MLKQFPFCLSLLISTLSLSPFPALAQGEETPTLYRCKGGKTFQAQFLKNSVNLQLQRDSILNLPSVKAASGAKYSNGKVTLHTKGEEAFIQINQKILYDGCSSKLTEQSRQLYYTCDSQIAPFPRKENVSLAQAEKLLIQRDGDLFIYRCSPRL
ncbi:MAG: MliC family protein [Snowella sp.]|nr:MliC family protein [Snowella sp.]